MRMRHEQIDRRTFVKSAIVSGMACIGGYLGWIRWSSRIRAGGYDAALGEVFESAVGAEILQIGNDYLKAFGDTATDLDGLLAEVSGMDRARLTTPDTSLASRFRSEVHKRVANELARGELVQLHGYFVAPTFGRFCAAIALIAQRR